MAWEWLDTALDWGTDLLGGGDAWEDVIDFGGEVGDFLGIYDPVPDDAFDTGGSWDLGGLLNLGTGLLSDYQTYQGAQDLEQLYAPLFELGGQAQTTLSPYIDPTQRAAMQAAEEERLTGLLTPFVERAAYRGRASDLSQGVGDSSIADWRDQERQRQAAELISQHVVPTAASNVQQAGTATAGMFGSLADIYKPTVQAGGDGTTLAQSYIAAQQQASPLSFLLDI